MAFEAPLSCILNFRYRIRVDPLMYCICRERSRERISQSTQINGCPHEIVRFWVLTLLTSLLDSLHLEYDNIYIHKACFALFSTAGDVIGSSKFPADLAALCPIDSSPTDRQREEGGGPKDGRSNTVTNCGRYRYLCFFPSLPARIPFVKSGTRSANARTGVRRSGRDF